MWLLLFKVYGSCVAVCLFLFQLIISATSIMYFLSLFTFMLFNFMICIQNVYSLGFLRCSDSRWLII